MPDAVQGTVAARHRAVDFLTRLQTGHGIPASGP
jgi:hypothetical protein